MLTGTPVVIIALGYALVLLLIAWWGDNYGKSLFAGRLRAPIYALSLAVYCTSWTYYGSVGVASARGLDFLPIYIGPVLVLVFGRRLIARVAAIARAQNITSIADFVAARYGKSPAVGATVALIALMGSAPYMALQLKAIMQTIMTVVVSLDQGRLATGKAPAFAFVGMTLALAGFAMAFGTRRIDSSEHQDGLVLAVAAESLVKLVAFLGVGVFVVWGLHRGLGDIARIASADSAIADVMRHAPDPMNWAVTTLLSACAIIMLPRQFHVMIVENRNIADIGKAAWLFPLYLVAINLFVAPLAIAGLSTFANGAIDRDLTVLALPLNAGARGVALATMLGGLSAATAMIVVASVAVSIMVSNEIVMPLILRGRAASALSGAGEAGRLVLYVRRLAILLALSLGYIYSRYANEAALASIGLLSFAAIAQIAPAFIAGLFWPRGTARGALAGLIAGFGLWAYALFLPSLASGPTLDSWLEHGPLAVAWLRPAALLGLNPNPLVGGALLSLGANIIFFVAVSLTRRPTPIERAQAMAFIGRGAGVKAQAFRLWRAAAGAGEVEATVAHYLGAERTQAAFDAFDRERGTKRDAAANADAHLIRHAEYLLSSAIGASTARLVLSQLFRRRAMPSRSALKLIDDASAAFRSDRDQLQHALDHARQGIAAFDHNLTLQCWNREFVTLFDLSESEVRVGLGLDEMVRANALRGVYGPGAADEFIASRIASLLDDRAPFRLRIHPSLRVIEVRSARLPDGGVVTTYADVSASVAAEEQLALANAQLEQRVLQRTAELERLNRELALAKTTAEDANLSKTRFLAAASHDILQPLNAARLYASALNESAGENSVNLARRVEASLEAVEEILGAILDISRLDAGATRPEISDFSIDSVFRQLEIEFAPMAREKGLALKFVASTLYARSDRRLLRRLLQNLVSNALKYTPRGRVLVGCRKAGKNLRLEVWDTGLGIPLDKQREVFEEFLRLDQGADLARGLGLGLSIVERLARLLGHPVDLASRPGAGSKFSVEAPLGVAQPASMLTALAAPVDRRREPLSDLNVLAIDNEPRSLEGMRELLSLWGCAVKTALSRTQAFEQFGDGPAPLDVIIADYHLDHDNGIAAINALRTRFGQEIPAILATADHSAEVREAALQAKITLLHKPLKAAALRALLARSRSLRVAAE